MNKKQIASLMLAGVMLVQGSGMVFAQDNNVQRTNSADAVNTLNNNLNEYDKYVVVKNNQYVLELPSNANVTPAITNEIEQRIAKTNQIVYENNLFIDLNTKVATLVGKFENGEGVNSIDFYWNYARICLSGTVVRMVLQAGAGGAAAIIGASLPVTNLVAIGISGVVFGGLSSLIGDCVKDGIWFDDNYVVGVFCGNWGWQ